MTLCASIAGFLAILLAGCATPPPVPVPAWMGKRNKASLVEAAAMTEGLRGRGIEAGVLGYL